MIKSVTFFLGHPVYLIHYAPRAIAVILADKGKGKVKNINFSYWLSQKQVEKIGKLRNKNYEANLQN